MINTFYSNTSHVRQQSETQTFERDASKHPESTANDAILARLAKNIPGLQKDDVTNLANNEFSATKIAETISKFVALGLETARNNGASDAEIQSKYDAALSGVKKGFAEARDILENLQVLTAPLAEKIDHAEQLTFDALALLNPSNDTDSILPAYYTQAASVERYSHAETFSLDLKTQDGDSITITFANQSSQQSAFAYAGDDQGSYSAIFNMSQSQSSAFQFQVEGDLDEDELAAIASLIGEMAEISDEFFNGDVQKAFEIASEFQLDKTELASMNLQLTQSVEYSAASSYSSVQNNALSDASKLSGHLINNLAQATTNPSLDFLDNIQSVSQLLLDSLVRQDDRFTQASTEQQDIFSSSLDKIQDIIQLMLQARISETAADDAAVTADIADIADTPDIADTAT